MKILNKKSCRGFSLAELALSVAITVILLLVVFTIATTASDSLDSTNASVQRDKHADKFLDYIARDLESIVIVEGSEDAYLSLGRTIQDSPRHLGLNATQMTNNMGLCFYTAATDRYEGKIGPEYNSDPDPDNNSDGGGDVSCISYNLSHTNYVNGIRGTETNENGWNRNSKYSAYRVLLYPDLTYKAVLGEDDVRERMYRRGLGSDGLIRGDTVQALGVRHLIAENIFELSCVFNIEYTQTSDGATKSKTVFIKPQTVIHQDSAPATQPTNNIGSWAKIRGTGFESNCKVDTASGEFSIEDAQNGGYISNVKAKSVTVILSVMDSTTQTLISQRTNTVPLTREQVLAKCRTFSRTVQLP